MRSTAARASSTWRPSGASRDVPPVPSRPLRAPVPPPPRSAPAPRAPRGSRPARPSATRAARPPRARLSPFEERGEPLPRRRPRRIHVQRLPEGGLGARRVARARLRTAARSSQRRHERGIEADGLLELARRQVGSRPRRRGAGRPARGGRPAPRATPPGSRTRRALSSAGRARLATSFSRNASVAWRPAGVAEAPPARPAARGPAPGRPTRPTGPRPRAGGAAARVSARSPGRAARGIPPWRGGPARSRGGSRARGPRRNGPDPPRGPSGTRPRPRRRVRRAPRACRARARPRRSRARAGAPCRNASRAPARRAAREERLALRERRARLGGRRREARPRAGTLRASSSASRRRMRSPTQVPARRPRLSIAARTWPYCSIASRAVAARLGLAREDETVGRREELRRLARRRLQEPRLVVRVPRGGREVRGPEREEERRPERREARPAQEVPRLRARAPASRGDAATRILPRPRRDGRRPPRTPADAGAAASASARSGPSTARQPSCRAESPSLLNRRRTALSSAAEPVIRSAMRAKSPWHSWKSWRNAERSSSRRKSSTFDDLRARKRQDVVWPGSRLLLARLGEQVEQQPVLEREDDASRPVQRRGRAPVERRREEVRQDHPELPEVAGPRVLRDGRPSLARQQKDDGRAAARELLVAAARARTRRPSPAPARPAARTCARISARWTGSAKNAAAWSSARSSRSSRPLRERRKRERERRVQAHEEVGAERSLRRPSSSGRRSRPRRCAPCAARTPSPRRAGSRRRSERSGATSARRARGSRSRR